jgi:DNA ligase (NAD+)
MRKFTSTEEKIKFLKECAKKYEISGTSELSDLEYDSLYAEAQREDPDNSFFDDVGGEIDKDHVYGAILPHKIIMGSLSKSLSIEEFEIWLNNNFNSKDEPQFLIQHKIDGLSVSLLYQLGKLTQCLTRGDGVQGVDVYANCLEIKDIPQTISYKQEVEVRGEIYKDRPSFKKWKDLGYANERNFASGSLNQKDPKVTGDRELSFIAYEIVRKDDFALQSEKNDFLEQNGFKTLKSTTRVTKKGNSFTQIAKAVDVYMNSIDRSKLSYLIDGVVAKLLDIKTAKKMGGVSGNRKPKSDRAIKYPSLSAVTTIEGIEVNVGRTGNLCPVGLLKEVEIDGCKIGRVTLHNFGMIVGKDALKIGAKVRIARKSDIIPQIIEVIENKGTEFNVPTTCPSCGKSVSWDSTHVNLVCSNYDCIAQLNRKIEFWFTTIGVKGFGKGTINKLTDANALEWEGKPIISSLIEMYYMLNNDRKTEHPFRKYIYLKSQLGEKTYENLLESIKSVKEVTLAKFIEALGIENIGTSSEDIAALAPTVDEVDKLTVGDLLKINGFGVAKANSFYASWVMRRDEIRRLLKYVAIKADVKASTKLTGKKFCFTGSFSKPREELQKIVTENDGKNANSVGKDVILVWDGSEMGTKYDKAIANKNEIISETDFFKLLD